MFVIVTVGVSWNCIANDELTTKTTVTDTSPIELPFVIVIFPNEIYVAPKVKIIYMLIKHY